jgi:hypothetical protein
MSIITARWVHGTIVEAESPQNLINAYRKGWGSEYLLKPGTSNWFHLPITTPVVVDGKRPVLSKVFVLFKTGGGKSIATSKLASVHLYDGKNKVLSLDNLNLDGDHSGSIDSSNNWTINPPITIYSGLGISVCVTTSPGPPPPVGPESHYLLLATAGADFSNS